MTKASNMCSNSGVSMPVIDPFPSVSAALANARTFEDQELTDALLDAEKSMRRLQADLAVLITEVVSRIEGMGYPLSGAAEELAMMLAVSPRSADRKMDTAVALCDREIVWGALFEGRVDLTKANVVLDLLADIPDPRREELELIAVGFAEGHTSHQLRRKMLALISEKDPDESLRDRAVSRRGVWMRPAAHGMAEICAYLSAEHAEIFMGALEKLAASPDCADPYGQGDERTAEQRRADALVGYVESHTSVCVNVDVVISADALIGDNDWTPESARLGPIGSALARDLCMSPDARWRRLVTDPVTGELVAMGTTRYRIPERLREAIKARDLTCRFPGCHARAEFFDCDHVIPHPAGATSADNLAGLCRRHHRTKTFSAWRVRRDPHAPAHDLVWTSPLGHTYRTSSHRYKQDE